MYWKTFAGRCIYQSVCGTRVHQNGLYRWLTFDRRALQTLINRHHPQRIELAYITPLTLAARAAPGSSCLLGLGGAGVAHALIPFLGGAPFTAVEYAEDVIEIAAAFFMTNHLKPFTIIHQDAQRFVQHTTERFQHVMVDLATADAFPPHCNSADFFAFCRACVLPGGVLAVNLPSFHAQRTTLHYLQQNFPQCTVSIPIRGTSNVIVLAYHGHKITPLLEMIQQERRLKKLTWCATWGCVATF